jgi:hypothetical protein
LLKIRKLFKNREAENAVAAEIARNWNVSETQDFSFAKRNLGYRVTFDVAPPKRASWTTVWAPELTLLEG